MAEQLSSKILLGAVAGDIIGSRFEWHPIKSEEFELIHPDCHFTDDSVLTLAVAEAILEGKNYQQKILDFAKRYPQAGYGGRFQNWVRSGGGEAYNSFGNGSAMRVSAIGWAFNNEVEVLQEAQASAEVTHNHSEGIKGAQATALAIFLARKGVHKDLILQRIINQFNYSLDFSLNDIRPNYDFDVTCQGTVPPALVAFYESQNYEDAVRKAISLGGDADTLAAITGAIAEAYYGGIPIWLEKEIEKFIPAHLRCVIERFNQVVEKLWKPVT
jgi:ADP-ribosylglycohydrolase